MRICLLTVLVYFIQIFKYLVHICSNLYFQGEKILYVSKLMEMYFFSPILFSLSDSVLAKTLSFLEMARNRAGKTPVFCLAIT